VTGPGCAGGGGGGGPTPSRALITPKPGQWGTTWKWAVMQLKTLITSMLGQLTAVGISWRVPQQCCKLMVTSGSKDHRYESDDTKAALASPSLKF
jgi:hypothetical protein